MNAHNQIQEATSPPKGLCALPAIQSLAKTYDLSPEQFVFTFKAMAMPASHSDAEFVACCLVAREHGLNPLTKEIYFMKTKSGAIQPIVSVDGWVRKCNEHPQFDGMEFQEISSDTNEPIAMTCTIFRKDRGHPTRVTEHIDECRAVGGAVWKTSPRRMLRHRALTQAARYAFGFAGVMDRDEFDQWQSMRDVTPARAAPLEIPDIPDAPTEAEASQENAETVGKAEAEKFLIHLEENISLCSSAEELAEIADHNADMISRLPKAHRLKAATMLSEAAE